MKPTKFSERVFAILDQDMSGFLDLREFVVGLWNYCTYDTALVTKVADRGRGWAARGIPVILASGTRRSRPEKDETSPCKVTVR